MTKNMALRSPSSFWRYTGAVAAVAIATWIRMLLAAQMGITLPFITYFPAVMFVAWHGRLGPTLLATGLGALGAAYFFIPPADSILITDPGEILGFAIFVLVGIFNALFSEAWHRAAGSAARNASALEESRKALSTTLMSIGDAVIATDAEARVTFLNPVAQSLTGYSEAEASEKNIKEVFRIINEQTRGEVENPVEKVLREGQTVGLVNHTVLISKDGTETPIDDSGAPIRDDQGKLIGVVLVFRDITGRRRVEAEMAESRARLAGVIDSAMDAIITVDENQRVLLFNYAAEEMFGCRAAEAIGGPLERFIPERFRAAHRDHVRSFGSTRVTRRRMGALGEIRGLRSDGTEFPIEASISQVDAAGQRLFTVLLRDITDSKRAQETASFLAAIVESSQDAIFAKTLDGIIISWNAGAERIYGYTASDVIGKDVSMLAPDDRREEIPQILEGLRRGDLIHHLETVRVRKDGALMDIALTVSPVRDSEGRIIAASTIARDITRRKRAEEALRESEERFRKLTDSAPVLIWVNGLEGCEFVNRSYLDFLGVSDVDVSQYDWTRFIHEDDRDGYVNSYLEAFAERRHFEAQFRFRRADGEYRWMKSIALPRITPTGNFLGYVGSTFDITDVKQAIAEREDALRLRDEFLKREQAAREEAEAASRAKDEFLATVSHELRTPLNAILGWSHMLRNNEFDKETTARALETIERNAKSQTQLIEDILDVSRIITGKLRLDVQPIELAPIVEAAIQSIRPAADAKEIRLETILDPRAGPISGDPNRLQQIVWNLVSNAVKFTTRGGRVQVRLERVNSHVEIIVSDTGEGINREFLPHVFDRFRQADATSTRRHGGLGLGLAIVRHLAEMHGGTVEAESAGEGKGATFRVKLPLIVAHFERRDAAHTHTASERSIPLAEAPRLDGITVMVVDDEGDARDLLETILRQFGAEVKSFPSSAEAITHLHERKPDVIVSDIEMPEEDGYSFIRRLREMETDGQTPAVALTAYARTEDRLRALSAGYQIHIAKPVEPVELAVVISSLAKRSGKGG